MICEAKLCRWGNSLSLISFLKIKEVKEKFRETFKKPNIKLERELQASPQTANCGLAGTAFDYLTRFFLSFIHSNTPIALI